MAVVRRITSRETMSESLLESQIPAPIGASFALSGCDHLLTHRG